MRWIDRQLSPDGIDDHRLVARARQFQILEYDRGDLAAMYTEAQRERRERKLAAGPTRWRPGCREPDRPTRQAPRGRIH